MRIVQLALPLAACAALAACNKTDMAPRPAHSDVATAMPDAASTEGAQGPAAAAPHAAPPPAATLSDTQPPPAGSAGTSRAASPTANPADHPSE
jgi:hypothetical protein